MVCAAAALALAAFGCEDDKGKGASGGTSATTSAPKKPASAANSVASAKPSDSAKPPPAAKPTPVEAAKATSQKVAEAINAHDAKKWAALYAEDVLISEAPEPDAKGRAAVEKAAQMWFDSFKDIKITMGRIWVNKQTSVVEWTWTGMADGDVMGMKVSKKPVGNVGVVVITTGDDGLIKSERRYSDGPTVFGQIDPKAAGGQPVRPPPTALPAGSDAVEAKGTPDETKNLDVAKKLYAAVDEHKVDEILSAFTDDCVYDDFSSGETQKGKKAIKPALEGFLKALPDLKQPLEQQFAAGDYVVTIGPTNGTQKGALGPLKASNKPVSMHFVDVMQYKDGKVNKAWTYQNSAEMLVQIGAMKLPTAPPAASGSASAAPHATTAPPPTAKPTQGHHQP
jgi:steroid delta-isomerase-like uncharacterized protein